MKKLKLDAEHIRRLRLREEFSDEYKYLNTLIRANAPTVYAIFKYAFYDVKDGRELLIKRGIKGKLNKYLDYIDEKELKYLIRGLKKINAFCTQPNTKYKGFTEIYIQMAKMGKKLRYQFFRTYKVYPENNPLCNLATRYIKSAAKKQEIKVLTNGKSLQKLQNEYDILLQERNRLNEEIEQTNRKLLSAQLEVLQNNENKQKNKNKDK